VYTLKSMLFRGHTTEKTWLGFSVVLFLLVGHFPYYRSLDLTLIKNIRIGFSSRVFLGVYT
jgi:hypothetical protein